MQSDLNIPTDPKQFENRALTDAARELPTTANPFLEEGWIRSVVISNARRIWEFFKQLRILELEAIPVTAKRKLSLWASFWGITYLPATHASGIALATGTPGSVIPQSTILQSSEGNQYSVGLDATIIATSISVSSLTNSGLTATAVIASDQSLFAGLEVTIAGANESPYNGTFEILEVLSENSFSYTMASNPGGPATGTITAAWTSAVMEIQSLGFGQDQNLDANEKITFSTPIAGVDNAAFVDFGAVGGGTDQETDTELRARMLDRVQNPVAMFNAAQIQAQAKKVAGVTDVFVEEVTPDVGQVTIYFIRGNDASPIPTPGEVDTVKNKILEIKPAHVADADVIVAAPTEVATTFTFSALSPNTSTMQAAITANLRAMLLDEGVVGQAITSDQYRSAIIQTVDPQTGEKVSSFTLTTPAGSLGGGAGEYVTLDAVNFP